MAKGIKAAVDSVKKGLQETKDRKVQHDKWVTAGKPGMDKREE